MNVTRRIRNQSVCFWQRARSSARSGPGSNSNDDIQAPQLGWNSGSMAVMTRFPSRFRGVPEDLQLCFHQMWTKTRVLLSGVPLKCEIVQGFERFESGRANFFIFFQDLWTDAGCCGSRWTQNCMQDGLPIAGVDVSNCIGRFAGGAVEGA